MVDQRIQYPAIISPRYPYTHTAADLRTQKRLIKAGEDSRFSHTPAVNVPRSRAESIALQRVMFVRDGCAPTGENETLFGPLTNQELLMKWYAPNHGYISSTNKTVCTNSTKAVYGTTHLQLMNEAYGPKSFLLQWVDGVSCEEGYLTKLTNWDLYARINDIEGDAAAACEYRDAVEILQEQVKLAYRMAWKEESGPAKILKGVKAGRAASRRDFYAARMNITVQPLHAGRLIPTAGELRSYIVTPLFRRSRAVRIAFWKQALTPDAWTSFFGRNTTVVNLA